jgi:23S rRNA pseudouridine2605 synthase
VKPVPLNRALSKLGVLSRAQATEAIRSGRVAVGGRVVRDPARPVIPERARIAVDGALVSRAAPRTLLLYKPRGVVTTRRDPEGRPTVYDVVGEPARGLSPVGRLDFATSGLLLLTNDSRLAHWITNPDNAVPRTYLVTVRGAVSEDEADRLLKGLQDRGETLRASRVQRRKVSNRESYLIIELLEGRNRELRRMFAALGREITRLKRVGLGGLTIGSLGPGGWRQVTPHELSSAGLCRSHTRTFDKRVEAV